MRRFTQLFTQLDRTTKTSAKVAALREYFAEAPPRDAAWAVGYLIGQRGRRPVTRTALHRWLCEVTELPAWLIEECYAHRRRFELPWFQDLEHGVHS